MKSDPTEKELFFSQSSFLIKVPPQGRMSEYPQLFNSLAKYLNLATELSGKDQYAQCAAYYCRYYWVKKAGEMLNQKVSVSDTVSFFLVLLSCRINSM